MLLSSVDVIRCDHSTLSALSRHLGLCLKLLKQFEWLLDAYVVDFFISNDWERLPKAWRETLEAMQPSELATWLETHKPALPAIVALRKPIPLSLLALR